MVTKTFVGRVAITETVCGTTSTPNLCIVYADGEMKVYGKEKEERLATELTEMYGNELRQRVTYNRRNVLARNIELGPFISKAEFSSLPKPERKKLETLVKKLGAIE